MSIPTQALLVASLFGPIAAFLPAISSSRPAPNRGSPAREGASWTRRGSSSDETGSPAGAVTLPFRGRIDGSDRIRITREGAEWTHLHWAFPEGPVLLNDVAWDPASEDWLPNTGERRLLPEEVDFRSAVLRRIQGRDTVALECSADSVTVHVDDTPCGSDLYEFEIGFRPAPPATELRVAARIDGSDRLKITRSGASWSHRHWGWPQGPVWVNGLAWDPLRGGHLPNSGPTRFLPSDVDFATAEVVSRTGRDVVAVETLPDGMLIHFADNPNGDDLYEVVVRLRADPLLRGAVVTLRASRVSVRERGRFRERGRVKSGVSSAPRPEDGGP